MSRLRSPKTRGTSLPSHSWGTPRLHPLPSFLTKKGSSFVPFPYLCNSDQRNILHSNYRSISSSSPAVSFVGEETKDQRGNESKA